MSYEQTTARIEHEFSLGYIHQNPEFTADRLVILINKIRESDMEISFDFSAASRATLVIFSPSTAEDLNVSCSAEASTGKEEAMSCMILVKS